MRLRQFAISASRWNDEVAKKGNDSAQHQVEKQESSRQVVGQLAQVVTKMQLTYTCKVCSTRQGVETAVGIPSALVF
jgi:ribosomal protein L44E